MVCTRSACVPFQSTHPARGATAGGPEVRRSKHISIHAPREGCDQGVGVVLTKTAEFQSTHPARGATTRTSTAQANVRFQSTHPARGATAHKRDHARRILYFNPRTPRGVRPPTKGIMLGGFFISIHAPREGCDSRCPQPELPKTQFQSTHPARGATRISTHCCVTCTFQSTHPARGATRCSRGCLDTRSNFNPRTPRGVRPLFVSAFDQYDYDFNPRTPRGVRRHHQVPSIAGTRFQSTHPARGATGGAGQWRGRPR